MATPEMLEKHRVWLHERLDYKHLFKGYIQAIGFTAHAVDDEGEDRDSLFTGAGDFDSNWDVWYEIKDIILDEDLQTIMDDLTAFHTAAEALVDDDEKRGGDWEQAGVDFHFTRNSHGAGFWDGDWSNGDELTSISEPFSTLEMEGKRDSNGELVEVYFHN